MRIFKSFFSFFYRFHLFPVVVFFATLVTLESHAADPQKENAWSRIRQPIVDTPQALGGYTHGCQFGAQMLEEVGDGFISIRRWRNRFYSQPVTLSLIRSIGHHVAGLHGMNILIGDQSLPAGGRMPFGHASHQNGLDVDIWFYALPQGQFPPPDIKIYPLVDRGRGEMIAGKWQPVFRDALFAAAQFPETERIFVNPIIKQYLCDTEIDRRWLRKVRPWFGHDEHFHVRVRCPAGNYHCEPQNLVPPGDGCDNSLRQWVEDQRQATLFPKPPKKNQKPRKPKLAPPMCLDLIR